MSYRAYLTQAGYELQAKLFAQGGELEITRVEVGSGACTEETDPYKLTGLIHSMARATSTAPRREGFEVALEIEYRSEHAPELERPFQINEFGLFAIGADGEEALILYGDISTCPDTAVPLRYGGCVRRYPVNITVGPDATVSLAYPAAAWMTVEEVLAAIKAAIAAIRPDRKAIASRTRDPARPTYGLNEEGSEA